MREIITKLDDYWFHDVDRARFPKRHVLSELRALLACTRRPYAFTVSDQSFAKSLAALLDNCDMCKLEQGRILKKGHDTSRYTVIKKALCDT